MLFQILTEQEHNACVQPVILTQPAAVSVSSEHDLEDEEEDWQQLSALPQPSAPSTSSNSSQQTPPLLYIDHSAAEAEPMGFRELFLRSNALENLFAGKWLWQLNHAMMQVNLAAVSLRVANPSSGAVLRGQTIQLP